jgi:hypothetical protein
LLPQEVKTDIIRTRAKRKDVSLIVLFILFSLLTFRK